MKIITDQLRIDKAQHMFLEQIRSKSQVIGPVNLGFRGGSTTCHVFWLPSHDFWAYFGDPPDEQPNRYWNAFGVGKPSGQVSITIEINLPKIEKKGQNIAGLVFEDNYGRVHLGRKGHINAGKMRSEKFVKKYINWKWDEEKINHQRKNFMPIGDLNADDFVTNLGNFIHEVARFKDKVKNL